MSAGEKILTLHPRHGPGIHIDAKRYREMRTAILDVVPNDHRGIALERLPDAVRPHLSERFGGGRSSVPWYCVTVELDLEARGLIERVPSMRPQRIRRPSLP